MLKKYSSWKRSKNKILLLSLANNIHYCAFNRKKKLKLILAKHSCVYFLCCIIWYYFVNRIPIKLIFASHNFRFFFFFLIFFDLIIRIPANWNQYKFQLISFCAVETNVRRTPGLNLLAKQRYASKRSFLRWYSFFSS